MKLVDPIVEKLKSCGRKRFTEKYRILRECFERIMNGTSSDSDDQSLSPTCARNILPFGLITQRTTARPSPTPLSASGEYDDDSSSDSKVVPLVIALTKL
ncbi:unnamed protein product [Dibothriocephalus latus]|uniref:Uncharacterized protein n=1 Tax=Dibothriocephalus latus TaxID=60516 RepID=A0A3P7PXE4_DIBLA|nr:unnamed protein product [Dibothriocephalus latus]